LLLALTERAGAIVTREQLYAALWPGGIHLRWSSTGRPGRGACHGSDPARTARIRSLIRPPRHSRRPPVRDRPGRE